jgi:hypothetical protein
MKLNWKRRGNENRVLLEIKKWKIALLDFSTFSSKSFSGVPGVAFKLFVPPCDLTFTTRGVGLGQG